MNQRLALAMVSLAASAPGQGIEGRPEIRELRIAPGAYVDLDTGVVLPGRDQHPFVADLVFDRDGVGFFVRPLIGAIAGQTGDESVPDDDWSTELHRFQRHDNAPRTLFAQTDQRAVARVWLSVVDPYSTASAILQWTRAPASQPVFLTGPEDLSLSWEDGAPRLTWAGRGRTYLVEIQSGDERRNETTERPEYRLEGLEPGGLYRVLVRELMGGGVVSLPSTITVPGRRVPSRRGVAEYPDRWYDSAGGIDLRKGEPVGEDADVVFYLYGVYVPGGGVQKMGQSREVFDRLQVMPEAGYLPVYGRLDDFDVLAVRLRDGRYAALFLDPADGRDVRGGMRVHFRFLEGGGRSLPSRPEAGEFEADAQGNLTLSWTAAPDAETYRLELPDGSRKTLTERETSIGGLPANRFLRFRVYAVDAIGDESAPLTIDAHTYSDEYRLGSFELDAYGQQGYSLTLQKELAYVRGAEPDADLELVIVNAAGGASYLAFSTPYGSAATDLEFGAFPDRGNDIGFQDNLGSDDRMANSERFLLKTKDGDLAFVRIRERAFPRPVIEYVLRSPR